jgi:Na+/H+ antiporter NhaC
MKYLSWFLLIFVSYLPVFSSAQADQPTMAPPTSVAVREYQLSAPGGELVFSVAGQNGPAYLTINGERTDLDFSGGRATLAVDTDKEGKLLLIKNGNERNRLYHVSLRKDDSLRLRHIPMWLSILPPLLAILLALIFREVVLSLFVGVWSGAFIAGGLRFESIAYFFLSFLRVVEKYIIEALNDTGHLSIVIFSLLIGGMVAIISRNGGMAGIVQELSRFAQTRRSTQFVTWLLGVAIFFDDYANTLIVGNTMRSATDKFRISREKLAYIVDSTAAPVAAIAFITTWIGAELGYIDDGISVLTDFPSEMTAYAIFISSLKYSFYPILTLIFILLLIYSRREYGGMYRAEKRAIETGQVSRHVSEMESEEAKTENLDPVRGAPLKWYNAFFPVLTVILMTIVGLVSTGMDNTYDELIGKGIVVADYGWGATWQAIGALGEESDTFFMKLGKLIGNADSYVALLWASTAGVILAFLMTVAGRIMRIPNIITTMITGFKTMLPALIILTLAWSLAATTEELHTATYLSASLKDSLNPYFVPAIIFILSALIAFSTGSSWSTMAILYPIAMPLMWAISHTNGMPDDISMELLFNVIATVLAASVLGDHCSPISDTTILSSLASDCNHIDHVRTQLPYALTVGGVSLVAGTVSTLLGGGWLIFLILLLASVGLLYLIILQFGKKIE